MMTVVEWTGAQAAALRRALRMTIVAFSDYLGVGARTISKWESRRETIVLTAYLQEVMDTALDRATAEQRARFARLCQEAERVRPAEGSLIAEAPAAD